MIPPIIERRATQFGMLEQYAKGTPENKQQLQIIIFTYRKIQSLQKGPSFNRSHYQSTDQNQAGKGKQDRNAPSIFIVTKKVSRPVHPSQTLFQQTNSRRRRRRRNINDNLIGSCCTLIRSLPSMRSMTTRFILRRGRTLQILSLIHI